ncbi:putative G protein alpha chain [Favolaschia claudopus]|uniref:G protein alpha chain n=1 Tax=Favolaschia claudopus TaxID=2862362 RepID=A0AAW0CM28_9AGAR
MRQRDEGTLWESSPSAVSRPPASHASAVSHSLISSPSMLQPLYAHQNSCSSLHSWWSDSNPNLAGPTLNIHALAKPLLKVMYHRQAMEFIKQSRETPLTSETVAILSSYLPLNYVSTSTKISILEELVDRLDIDSNAIYPIVNSPLWPHLPQLLESGNTEIWSLASQLFVSGGASSGSSTMNLLEPILHPSISMQPPRIWRRDLSTAIDRALILDGQLRQREESKTLRIIVLGTEKSGKSTLVTGLRNYLAPQAFQLEVDLWRPIIRLNLVRSINFILNLILLNLTCHGQHEHDGHPQLVQLATKLAPVLREVEETLFDCVAPTKKPSEAGIYRAHSVAEFSLISLRLDHPKDDTQSADHLLNDCLADIYELWNAAAVQELLDAQNVTLQHQPGFFLDDSSRICDEKYVPTPGDLLRTAVDTSASVTAPVKTEIKVATDAHRLLPRHWTIYEMKSSERAPWAQFIDDVRSLIFLIPISAFDETYSRNGSEINQLEESLNHWRMLCENRLLAPVTFTVCLNKTDILARKLQAGKQFSEYVISYKNKPNEPKAILQYISQQVRQIHWQSRSRLGRILDIHHICAIDPDHTYHRIVNCLQDNLFREALQRYAAESSARSSLGVLKGIKGRFF